MVATVIGHLHLLLLFLYKFSAASSSTSFSLHRHFNTDLPLILSSDQTTKRNSQWIPIHGRRTDGQTPNCASRSPSMSFLSSVLNLLPRHLPPRPSQIVVGVVVAVASHRPSFVAVSAVDEGGGRRLLINLIINHHRQQREWGKKKKLETEKGNEGN